MLQIKDENGGLSFAVRVSPRASRDQLAGEEGGALKVRLCAPPVDGQANEALLRLVAKALSLPRRDVSLASGPRSRQKRLLVKGLGREQLLARLGL
ncbi:protein of unknown function DUF167 [Desulfarculus baarsii DSM 2075]|uniref:UPF0235 protein Deba_0928 n=1 Tax=Desulfarculus baarsii (strain ATCC 33931 / DSM 2075 / LMG 7858 / VKM B-1802 / 2st14) TaxID=644282 RepID=E1QFG2_DESB2|nr:DUF167 domain-containing protein [Desulfarculus baarsii]ADK84298.1 protein of unknown function DUF167 [Desulfarculus baarsii DSM 2075]